MVLPSSLFTLFECLSGAAYSKKLRKGFWLVSHTSSWVIWKTRNNVIFANGKEIKEVVDEIIFLSWQWGLSRLKMGHCLLYEWLWYPGNRMLR